MGRILERIKRTEINQMRDTTIKHWNEVYIIFIIIRCPLGELCIV